MFRVTYFQIKLRGYFGFQCPEILLSFYIMVIYYSQLGFCAWLDSEEVAVIQRGY